MLLKVSFLFLVFMGVLAMFGKLSLLKWLDPRNKRISSKKCRACGAPKIGTGACPCGKR